MNNDTDVNMLACFLVYHSIPSLKVMVASDLEGKVTLKQKLIAGLSREPGSSFWSYSFHKNGFPHPHAILNQCDTLSLVLQKG